MCALLLCVLTSLTLAANSVHATEVTNDSIKEKEASIEASKQQRSEIQSALSDVEAIKEQLESSKEDLTAYVTQLDAQTAEIQAKIDDLKAQIEETQAQIEETEAELEEAQRIQDEQYAAMKSRIKFMYEKGDTYYLEVFAQAGSFADILNKATYISEISRYDQEQLQAFKEQTRLVEATKEDLDGQKETLDAEQEAAEQEYANIEALVAEKEAQITSISGDIADKEAAIAEYDRQLAAQDSAIASLEAAVAAEKAALNARHYSGGMFTWPCPNYTYISSDYGYRTHPIYGVQKFHSGLDLAASYGDAVLAAYEGTVVASSYDSSMGNYIMINHGDGLYTVYMHLQSSYVSKGQDVSAGEQIGAVGSTGSSTGPHLHFSVRLNGSYVSPWSYLGS